MNMASKQCAMRTCEWPYSIGQKVQDERFAAFVLWSASARTTTGKATFGIWNVEQAYRRMSPNRAASIAGRLLHHAHAHNRSVSCMQQLRLASLHGACPSGIVERLVCTCIEHRCGSKCMIALILVFFYVIVFVFDCFSFVELFLFVGFVICFVLGLFSSPLSSLFVFFFL